MASFNVSVQSSVLKWARTSAHIDETAAANRLGVSLDQLQAWERGDASPTFRQLETLAAFYKRPLSVMYLPEPPIEFDPMREYRRLLESHGVATPTSLIHALQRVSEQQDVMQEIYDEENAPYPAISLAINLHTAVKEAGRLIRDWIGLDWDNQEKWAKQRSLVPRLSVLIEAREILVTQVQKLSLDVMRGCALIDHPFPAIMINGADAHTAKVFTLMHELVHIILSRNSISSFVPVTTDLEVEPAGKVERFCNAVAAEALMPEETLLEQVALLRHHLPRLNERFIDILAEDFGVSSLAMAIRLVHVGTLGRPQFALLEPKFRAREKKDRKGSEAENKDLPIYYQLKIRDYGRWYIREVADAYDREVFNASEVAGILEVKLNNLAKLRGRLTQPISTR
jgi:Zn-dependent peptidase ImmA (M78 family)